MWQTILGFFTGGVGEKIGNGVAVGSVLVALAPLGLWLYGHRDDNFVQFSLGQAAVVGGLLGFVALILWLTRRGS